jgi:hypothetical protein
MVLQTSTKRLLSCAKQIRVQIAREQGGLVRAASHGFSPEFVELVKDRLVAPERGSATGRALLRAVPSTSQTFEPISDHVFSEAIEKGGFKTILAVPMLCKEKRLAFSR